MLYSSSDSEAAIREPDMATGKRPAKDVIVIDSSDDEPDRAGSSTAVLPAPSPHKRAKLSPRSSPKASPPPARSGLGGMDRAAMEQARLERQRAREAATASSSVQTTISPATAAVAQASSAWRANGAKVATLASVAAQEIESDETDDGEKTVAPVPSTSGPSTSPQNGNAAGVPRRFWEAEVRPTFNVYHPDTPNALKIEDVITQPDELLLAIVSSFCLDTPWVCGLFPPATPLVLVKHPNKDPAKSADRQIDPVCRQALSPRRPGLTGRCADWHLPLRQTRVRECMARPSRNEEDPGRQGRAAQLNAHQVGPPLLVCRWSMLTRISRLFLVRCDQGHPSSKLTIA